MTEVSGRRILAKAQKRFRTEILAEYKRVADQVRGSVLSAAGGETGEVPVTAADRLSEQAGITARRMFVGFNDRSPFAEDGVTALAPYPLSLNKAIVTVTAQTVYAHRDWMKRNLPDDVYQWLARVPSHPLRELTNQFLRAPDESIEAYKERLIRLRIFDPNPLATYEAAHTWVDPSGYTLSRRIWRTAITTGQNLDEFLEDAIRQGMSARDIADRVEQFLLPGRNLLRTNRPYGTDASYYGMRLARTEIARAANQAALIAAIRNPYVDTVDVVRSANGDPTCKICPQHATIGIDGQRLREAYPVGQASVGPFHPHCMCRVQPNVAKNPAEITEAIRAIMQDVRQDLLVPDITPAQADLFIQQLIGRTLMNLMGQVMQLPLL